MSEKVDASWPEGAEERLKVLHGLQDKMSARGMADVLNAEFGMKITKNAILGKVFRLGLGTKKSKVPPAPKLKVIDEVASVPETAWVVPKGALKAPPPIAPVVPASAPVKLRPAEGYTLVELPMYGCRYATNEAPRGGIHRFCGKRSVTGKPYCDHHFAICYPESKQLRTTLARREAEGRAA